MKRRQAQLEAALDRIAAAIDPDSSVAVPQQLRGALEFGIASGQLPIGARLPSVRSMARKLGLSPVTVSNVYIALQTEGHLEARVGAGTFVSRNAQVADPEKFRAFEQAISDLVSLAQDCGISRADLATRIGMEQTRAVRPLRLLMLGNFAAATAAYADAVRAYLPPGDRIDPMLLSDVADAPPPGYDLVLAPRTLVPQARALFQDTRVMGLTVLPSKCTCDALGALPADAAVVGYSYFPTYVSIMKANLQRYAPQIDRLQVVVRGDEGELAQARVAAADVVVYATGAEAIAEQLRPGQTAFEFRHSPDIEELRNELLPLLETCRQQPAPR